DVGARAYTTIDNVSTSPGTKFANSTFTHCGRGVFVHANGAEITNCTFTYIDRAIELSGLESNSLIKNVTISNCGIGVDVIGTSSVLSIRESTISDNTYYGVYAKGPQLAIGCSEISDNGEHNI